MRQGFVSDSLASGRRIKCLTVTDGQGPFIRFWLPVLLRLNPARGAKVLMKFLGGVPIEKDGVAVKMLGALFSDRRTEGSNGWTNRLDPETLLHLTRALYRHVAESSDAVHEGAYSPGPRDHAQEGRRYLFNSLIEATGAAAYQAKLELSSRPVVRTCQGPHCGHGA